MVIGGCRRCGSRGLGWRRGLAVFVGEVEKAVSFGGLFQPVDEVLAQSGLASATRSSRRG